MVQIADRFENFLETYRRPDGSRWGGQDLHDATGGVVTRSYVTALRKGRIENPGFEKHKAIVKAMNFPPDLWFEDVESRLDVSNDSASWFLERDDKPALLDEEMVEALRDDLRATSQHFSFLCRWVLTQAALCKTSSQQKLSSQVLGSSELLST